MDGKLNEFSRKTASSNFFKEKEFDLTSNDITAFRKSNDRLKIKMASGKTAVASIESIKQESGGPYNIQEPLKEVYRRPKNIL